MKTTRYKGEVYFEGKTKCGICDKPIKFKWVSSVMMFWMHLCEDCDTELSETLPKGDEIAINIIHFDK